MERDNRMNFIATSISLNDTAKEKMLSTYNFKSDNSITIQFLE